MGWSTGKSGAVGHYSANAIRLPPGSRRMNVCAPHASRFRRWCHSTPAASKDGASASMPWTVTVAEAHRLPDRGSRCKHVAVSMPQVEASPATPNLCLKSRVAVHKHERTGTWAEPFRLMGCTRCLSEVWRPHWKAPLTKLYHAAASANREDDPSPGIRSPQKKLALQPAIRRPHLLPSAVQSPVHNMVESEAAAAASAGWRSAVLNRPGFPGGSNS